MQKSDQGSIYLFPKQCLYMLVLCDICCAHLRLPSEQRKPTGPSRGSHAPANEKPSRRPSRCFRMPLTLSPRRARARGSDDIPSTGIFQRSIPALFGVDAGDDRACVARLKGSLFSATFFRESCTPNIDPQIVGSPQDEDPKNVP